VTGRTAALSDLQPGLGSPAEHSQQVFRCVLDAMARPGLPCRLPDDVLAQLDADASSAALRAVLLMLLDGDTSVWIAPGLAPLALPDYLRFHAGVTLRAQADDAEFSVVNAAAASASLLGRLPRGSDLAPQQGATLILHVDAVHPGGRDTALPCNSDGACSTLWLTGPGVHGSVCLQVLGVPAEFWRERIAMQAAYPRGIDLMLVSAQQVVGLPRSTVLALERAMPGSGRVVLQG
jgi:alpha-D-ribose 1-methylphosphonate 5-triphosphate synthase subunit PhnH